jgi:hypothetical protein
MHGKLDLKLFGFSTSSSGNPEKLENYHSPGFTYLQSGNLEVLNNFDCAGLEKIDDSLSPALTERIEAD